MQLLTGIRIQASEVGVPAAVYCNGFRRARRVEFWLTRSAKKVYFLRHRIAPAVILGKMQYILPDATHGQCMQPVALISRTCRRVPISQLMVPFSPIFSHTVILQVIASLVYCGTQRLRAQTSSCRLRALADIIAKMSCLATTVRRQEGSCRTS